MPRIVFKKKEHDPVELVKDTTVGRSDKHADVVVKDNRLSRAHCRFEQSDDGWGIADLESQNGTFLNGRRIQSAMLRAGDIVTIGACDMVVEENSGPGGATVMKGVQSQRSGGLDLMDDDAPGSEVEDRDNTHTVMAPAALVLKKGTLRDEIHPITKDEFQIGRKSDNDLCLEGDGKSSGHHAVIRRDGLTYTIEDLGSTNGVLVNGQKIDGAVQLKNGMKVVVGQQLFRFELQGRAPESSGQTAPMQARSIQDKLASQGEHDDLRDGASETLQTSVEEMQLTNTDGDDDQSALSQKVKYKSGGSTVFKLIEAVVVIAVAGAILFAAWTMLGDNDNPGGGEGGNYPPSRGGGLLTANSGFEDVDEGGIPRGWDYLVNGADSFNLVEGARGGRYAMQISRFGAGNQPSYLLSETMLVESGGITVSAYALNSEASSDRYGTALLSVFWYAHELDTSPMLVTPLGASTRLADWTEIKGSVSAPSGAKAWSVALGLTGVPGSVAFDDVSVQADDSAPDWFESREFSGEGGLTWRVANSGDISLSLSDALLIRRGRFYLHQSANRNDALDVLGALTGAPEVSESGKRLAITYRYFDPLAESNLLLQVELGGEDGRGTLDASIRTEGGSVSGASQYVSLHCLATPNWAPAEFVQFKEIDGAPREYRNEIGVGPQSADIGLLLSSNTGTGNKIIATGKTRVMASAHQQGREVFLQRNGVLALEFELGRGDEDLQQRISKLAGVQPEETELDRIQRALGIFEDYVFNQPEIAIAANAIDAVSKHYSLRLIELRDGINVPQLTRNEQLYRRAMREAISSAEELKAASQAWEETAMPMLRAVDRDGMNQHTRASADIARDALRELIDDSADFEDLAAVARKSLFALELEIEQRESESYMVSARDFLESGQLVQGMVKLRAVVENYPRCLRGVEAKERMVDVAEKLIKGYQESKDQGLDNIARDRALQARDLLDLVDDHLLVSILSSTERQWLRTTELTGEEIPGRWVDRESELKRRINLLRLKLPADLPAKEE